MLKNTNWKYNAPIKSKVFLIIDISEIDQNGAICLLLLHVPLCFCITSRELANDILHADN